MYVFFFSSLSTLMQESWGGWGVWLSVCLHDGRTIQFTLHLLLFCLVSIFHSLCARQYWSTFPALAEQEALFSLFLGKPLLHP